MQGNSIGILIGVLVVVVIIFLALREFWCWYWKINQVISLLEEQISLLRRQFGMTTAAILAEFKPTHRVKLLTASDGLSLREKPNPAMEPFTKLPDGTEVQHINTGAEIKLQDKKAPWYEVITKDGKQGWCFSGSLEKI
jgi:hypothetical protein